MKSFTRADLQRLLPGVALASLVLITVSLLLLVSLRTDRPPKAVLVLSKETLHPGEVLHLDARNSTDPDGGPLSFSWSIDGKVFSNQDRWSYVFLSMGEHIIELTVTDDEGATDRTTVSVLVTPWPEGTGP